MCHLHPLGVAPTHPLTTYPTLAHPKEIKKPRPKFKCSPQGKTLDVGIFAALCGHIAHAEN